MFKVLSVGGSDLVAEGVGLHVDTDYIVVDVYGDRDGYMWAEEDGVEISVVEEDGYWYGEFV